MNHETGSIPVPRLSCRLISALPAGGAVYDLAQDDTGRLWAGAQAGLFMQGGRGWLPVTAGLPLRSIAVLLAKKRLVLAAGLSGGLVRSADYGRSWQNCLLPSGTGSISSLCASPNVDSDGVVLAGTETGGILRSVDGGNSWKWANFGLRNFVIHDLAVDPQWDRREPVFVATDQGVYRSPNGGRAWQFCGLEQCEVVALAASLEVKGETRLAAGCADGSLFYSLDQGRSWQNSRLPEALQGCATRILYTGGQTCMAGYSSGQMLRSDNGGQSWVLTASLPGPVLTLASASGSFFAGAGQSGLYICDGTVGNWRPEGQLAARRFHGLAAGVAGQFAAASVEEGLWAAKNSDSPWRQVRVGGLAPAAGFGFAWEGEQLLATSSEGLLAIDQERAEAKLEIQPGMVAALAAGAGFSWAAGADGKLWRRGWESPAWSELVAPAPGRILSLTCAAQAGQPPGLLAVLVEPSGKELQFWESQDRGETWRVRWTERTQARAVRTVYFNGGWLVGLETFLLHDSPGSWQRTDIATSQAPLTALLSLAGGGLLAAALDRVLYSRNGRQWSRLLCPEPAAGIVDLQSAAGWAENTAVYALTVCGEIYLLEFGD